MFDRIARFHVPKRESISASANPRPIVAEANELPYITEARELRLKRLKLNSDASALGLLTNVRYSICRDVGL